MSVRLVPLWETSVAIRVPSWSMWRFRRRMWVMRSRATSARVVVSPRSSFEAASSLWVPIIQSWALTRGFALHPGTRNRYEIRYTRTQHRPPSRQVNDHGRVSGTHRLYTASI